MRWLTSSVAIIWGIFWIYWFIAAIGTKKNSNSRVRQFIGVRIIVLAVLIILIHSSTGGIDSFKNYHLLTNNKAVLYIGFVVFLLGLLIAIWARLYLGKNWGMPMTEKQDPELVTSGPYHYIRHPIYSGILLAGIGAGVAASVFWLAFLAFASPYFIYSALEEEKLMLKLFPKVYPAYKGRTKMLIPFIF